MSTKKSNKKEKVTELYNVLPAVPYQLCPKCGGKMKQLKRISATELGRINKASREWNTYTFMYKVDKYSDGLIKDYPKSAWGKGFLELTYNLY